MKCHHQMRTTDAYVKTVEQVEPPCLELTVPAKVEQAFFGPVVHVIVIVAVMEQMVKNAVKGRGEQ